jgi:bla regulator protein BlaR1
MDFQFLNSSPANWIQALGVTFFHSLWVGIIMALLTSIIIIGTRRSAASIRYNLLTALMCFFVIAVGFIFYRSLDFVDLPAQAARLPLPAKVNLGPLTQFQGIASDGVLNGLDGLMNFWFSYSLQIVMIWFFIICIKCIKLIANLNTISHLKKTQVFEAGKYWEQKVNEICNKLEITEPVRILQSGIAKIPLVAGHLKPIILVPIGFLNGLAPMEVEAILCHELAHIKRRDYLVNFIQSLIEIVFFFNPAILWVSRLIREERENCCDDLALSFTSDKKDYIKALISCEEYQFNTPEFAMSINGTNNQVLDRVKRMIYNKSTSLNTLEKTILTVVLISSFLLTSAFMNPSKNSSAIKSKLDSTVPNLQDTTKKAPGKKASGKISALTNKKTIAEAKRKKDQKNGANQKLKPTQEDLDAARGDAEAARADANASRADAMVAKEDARVAKEDARVAEEEAKLRQEEIRVTRNERKSAKGELTINENINRVSSSTNSSSSSIKPPAPPRPPVSLRAPAPPAAPSATDVMTKELLKDGIVRQISNLTYKLNKEELIVNGKRQPDAVHKKYRGKYLANDGQNITVRVNSN